MTDAVELVIFDCDGVLVDSEKLAIRVEARLLASLGWAIDESEILDRFVGRSDAHMLSEIEQELGRRVPEWQGLYQEALEAVFRSQLRPVPGVELALTNLDVPSCIASSGSHEKMKLTLGLTGLLPHFDRIFSATEVTNGKPAPDLFLHAASQCGVAPCRCVVVEDRRSGVQAARAAGMRALGYAGGLTPASPGAGVRGFLGTLVGSTDGALRSARPRRREIGPGRCRRGCRIRFVAATSS